MVFLVIVVIVMFMVSIYIDSGELGFVESSLVVKSMVLLGRKKLISRFDLMKISVNSIV